MVKNIAIGSQNFEKIRRAGSFYIDKTDFIKEWWEENDEVTLITRPRRFGKTLNMSMLESFFSVKYAGGGSLFEGLSIWEDEKYRALQGTYPVIFLSLAGVKANNFRGARNGIVKALANAYDAHRYLKESGVLNAEEEKNYDALRNFDSNPSPEKEIDEQFVAGALNTLSMYLARCYDKKVLIFLDEYDTPLQEAYAAGYWEELTSLVRSLFNASFKTNPFLDRAVMTGITRVGKESIFSDLNNLEVITTTTEKYSTMFGFTEREVKTALEQFGLENTLDRVRHWYDGFRFGSRKDIYNPWSITKYLDSGRFDTYWANTSSNSLVSRFIREAEPDVKIAMEDLLAGKSIDTAIDEEVVFNQPEENGAAIWSLLLASGYLKVESVAHAGDEEETKYTLSLTNLEVRKEFGRMVRNWFQKSSARYNDFVKALLANDLEYMNLYMNKMTEAVFSTFDTGRHPSGQTEPERFYHGFVLGLIVDAGLNYRITSNRESGFGRYDVMMEPRDGKGDAYLFEFKVKNPSAEATLEDTVISALQQIGEKNYDAVLIDRGIAKEKIRHYGFAFEGKRVLIKSTKEGEARSI